MLLDEELFCVNLIGYTQSEVNNMTTRKRKYVIHRYNEIQKERQERLEEDVEERKSERLGKKQIGGQQLKQMMENGDLPDY